MLGVNSGIDIGARCLGSRAQEAREGQSDLISPFGCCEAKD